MLVRRAFDIVVAASMMGLSACSTPPPPAEAPKAETASDEGRRRGGPSMESEIGGLDEAKVTVAFARANAKLTECYAKGVERVPYMAGDVHLAVRITKDGGTRWAYVKDSNLGDRDTEACMLGVLKNVTWPHPEGGEGLADKTFSFAPGGDERPPVSWSPEQLGAPYKNAKGTLAQCRKQAGTKGLKATFYVDTDGKPTSIGVSSADERGEAAVSCVVNALSALKFPSPGSYASKVSVSID
ncbi:putative abductin-like protein [Minicystis rosea]|nr:putative abductin-like protein [Minicystis rosea]